MRKMIFAAAAVCAVMVTACGNANTTVQSGAGTSAPETGEVQVAAGTEDGTVPRIQVESVDGQVISVNSREQVKVVPDMAEIVYAVTTQNQDAAACQKENGEKVSQLVETLKGLGVEEKSIQTSDFYMNPRYRNGTITGYESTTEVRVSDIKLEQTGEIMSNSVDSGVNQIRSVSFLSSQYDESYQEALKLAMASAREKAEALAEAGGCTLGPVVSVSEYSANDSMRYDSRVMMAAGTEAAVADMAVMPGEIEIEANITVEYAIQ